MVDRGRERAKQKRRRLSIATLAKTGDRYERNCQTNRQDRRYELVASRRAHPLQAWIHLNNFDRTGIHMKRLTLEFALRVIDGALARATELGCAPLTVVVLDAGGHDIALKRQDGSGILRVDIARGKAWGALGMGFSSREIAERAQKVPAFIGALAPVSQGRVVPAAGGVLILDDERNVAGAVGISGDTSDRDEDCALSGIKATG
jgi:uncharacterized protein GlcG (DUF336 family)